MNFVQPYVDRASSDLQSIVDSLQVSDAHFFDENRYNESDIRKVLDMGDSDAEKKIVAMKHVLAAVSYGRDCGDLFPHVVKNVPTTSLELKKLTYIYLVTYADCKPELALLSINSFQKDLTDRSQIIRASALRALSSVRTMEIIQIVLKSIRTAVGDTSAYVRKTAVHCIVKVFDVDRDQYAPLRDMTLKLLGDRNTSVVASALATFHHICVAKRPQGEGEQATFALLHPYFRRLVSLAQTMPNFSQACFADLMLRYARLFYFSPNSDGNPPQPSNDFASLVKCFQGLLRTQSGAVVLSAASALCYLSRSEDDVKCVIPPLLRCLRAAPWDNMAVLFTGFIPILRRHPLLFKPYLADFFVMQMDPNSIKLLKVEVLEQLADEVNVAKILAELKQYVRWHSYPPLVARSIRAISNVALSVESRPMVDDCLRDLVKMLDSKSDTVSAEAVVAIRTLLQQQTHEGGGPSNSTVIQSPMVESQHEASLPSPTRDSSPSLAPGSQKTRAQFWLQVISQLTRSLEDLTSSVARASVIWILGEYQSEVPLLAPDAVRKLARSFSQEALEVKHQILTLAFKVWAFQLFGNHEEDTPVVQNDSTAALAGDALFPPSSTPAEQQQNSGNSTSPGFLADKSREDGLQLSTFVGESGEGGSSSSTRPAPNSKNMVARLEKILDYIVQLAMKDDESWDLRDMARLVYHLKNQAKERGRATFASTLVGVFSQQPEAEALRSSLACVKKGRKAGIESAKDDELSGDTVKAALQSVQYRSSQDHAGLPYTDRQTWLLYSLARILDGGFASYHPLPEFSHFVPDSERDPPQEQIRQLEKSHEPKSLSSSTSAQQGFEFAAAQRVLQPSMIDKQAVAKLNSMADLDSFYAADEKVSVKSVQIVQQQASAREAVRAARKNPQFNHTLGNTCPAEDLSTFSLMPDTQTPVAGFPVGAAGAGGVPVMPHGAQIPAVPVSMPGVPAMPMPVVVPQIPQMLPAGNIVEGEDEESDDDWDLIKKNADAEGGA
ncbi:unnamed protein product [Amoebophrya sp. A25]|nr:unnamed protein product [Amoebophrya sp. A25]|eukprot:GSA25T00004342001.1